MTARNDITGDALTTGAPTDSYRDGWDRIFGKKPQSPAGEVVWTIEDEQRLDAAIAQRNEARKNKKQAEMDRIEAELRERGITLIDKPEGTTWSRNK